jgi:RNA polymerase sigma-70 factor (ECF subfamily)
MPLNSKTDAELISKANRGEEDAMRELYMRYRNWVFTLALSFCENREDSEEIMLDVFKYFFGKFPGFELTSALKTFFYPVIRNKSIDLIRKRKPHPEETFAENSEMEFRDSVRDIASNLPEMQRDIILMRFEEDLSLKEISERLKIPDGTVKSRLHSALKMLKEKFF